jgi:hypothetical protein
MSRDALAILGYSAPKSTPVPPWDDQSYAPDCNHGVNRDAISASMMVVWRIAELIVWRIAARPAVLVAV